MEKSSKLANIIKGIGYLLPLILVLLLLIFRDNAWVFLISTALVVTSVFVYWKFVIPLILMICYSVVSVMICLVESALKGLYLIFGLKFIDIIDTVLNGFRKIMWSKLVAMTENNVFKILDEK